MGTCDPGLRSSRDLAVDSGHCSDQMGSGELPVLSTPAILTLAENACLEAICDELPEHQTTVGAWAEVEHLVPTPIGTTVHADATLIGHHGRRLEFNVIVRDDHQVVAKVRHRRVLVDRDVFMDKVAASA